MPTLPNYPAPDRPLDGSEPVALWQDGAQRAAQVSLIGQFLSTDIQATADTAAASAAQAKAAANIFEYGVHAQASAGVPNGLYLAGADVRAVTIGRFFAQIMQGGGTATAIVLVDGSPIYGPATFGPDGFLDTGANFSVPDGSRLEVQLSGMNETMTEVVVSMRAAASAGSSSGSTIVATGNTTKGTTASAPGTGAFTPNAAPSGFLSWANEPVGFYFVRFDDGSAWALSFCYWNGTTLSRSATQVYFSSTGSPLALTSAATATKLGHPFEVVPPAARLTRQWAAGPSLSAPTAQGTSAPTVTGTGANVAVGSTNFLTEMPAIQYTSATTANAQAGLSYVAAAMAVVSTTAGRGGYEMEVCFGATTVPTGPRLFIGMSSLSFVANAGEPSAFVGSYAAFTLDSTDTNIQLLTNSNAGAGTKIDTGIPFVANQLYRCKIWISPGSNKVNALLMCPDTGMIFFTSTTTDVPLSGGAFPHVLGGLSATTGTAMVMRIGTATFRTGQ